MKEGYKHHGFWRVTGSIIGGVFIAAGFAVLIGALVMVLWNWLMPMIFGLGTITYWEGFGLVLLVKLLFGGIGHNGMEHGHKGPGKHWDRRYDRWYGRPGRWHGPGRRGDHDMHHFDDVYEDWWEKEGSASFEAFMNKKEPKQGGEKAEEKRDE